MNGWTVELKPSARREFRQLPEGPQQAAQELFEDLREYGPAQVQALELDPIPNNWRTRFFLQHYRMLYQVSRTRKHILVTRIRPRGIAYDGLKKPGPK